MENLALGRVHLLLIGLFLTGCGGQAETFRSNQAQFESAGIYATEAQNGSTVAVRPGQSFEIRLSESPTTDPPVQWTLSAAPPNLRFLSLAATPGRSGGPAPKVTKTFRFGAVAEGEGSVVFMARQAGRRISFRVVAASDMIID